MHFPEGLENTPIKELMEKIEQNSLLSKEYFPNILESALLPRFFVFEIRDFKF